MEKKSQRGGAREGSGRKLGVTFKEETKVMRIPVSKVEAVKKLIGLIETRPQQRPAKRSLKA